MPFILENPREKNQSWWKERTNMEKKMIIASSITLVLIVVLIVAILSLSPGQNEREIYDGSPCMTPGCVHASADILNYIDPSVKPCEDFYQFACGNFLKIRIPEDKSSVTSFTLVSDILEEQLRLLIEEPIQHDELKPFQATKKLYRACMNEALIEELDSKPILPILKEFGGWPVLDGDRWNEAAFDWKEFVYKSRKIGFTVDIFIDFSVVVDLKNSTNRIIDLDEALINLDRGYLIEGPDNPIVKTYFEYMVDVAVLLGANRSKAAEELKESLAFEIQLANISLSSESRRDLNNFYHPMTIEKLQGEHPIVPWLEYMNKLLAPYVEVTKDDIIIVNVPQYLRDFATLIEKTPKRVQANYAVWHFVYTAVASLSKRFRDRQLQYISFFSGTTEKDPRWKECIHTVAQNLYIALGAQYSRAYFKEEARQRALEMVSDISAILQDSLQKNKWMDSKTKKNALNKAESVTSHIGYPDEFLNGRELEEFYKSVEVDESDYFGSLLNTSLFETSFAFRRLRLPINKTDWRTHSRVVTVNANYNSLQNSIQFPAGILQGIFFNAERPNYMNYGAIGFIIAHEITHGFDDQGRLFDKNGELVEWWAPETKQAYLKRAQCFIEQYGNYTATEFGAKLNGVRTLGENIADNGGLKMAYLAYERWVQRNKEELSLPGLSYNSRQLFWISAASIWCSKMRKEETAQKYLFDEHALPRYRILGSFSNNEYFAKDFNCSVDSKMNPERKCQLW